ncbi:hypothetical protein [Capnocytophaga stomatis]|uniref:hypothetical protein n=1 Tax=Capnocytophaga stomatis TaxID=1848904 RepID=UPI0019522DEF|nr:hypothetical protein [Capnocytophaga stomatis]
MKTFFSIFLVVDLFCIVYLIGRVLFAIEPLIVNFCTKERFAWYGTWNRNRLLIVSLLLLLFVGITISFWVFKNFLTNNIYLSTFLSIMLKCYIFIVIEYKMDTPFKPLKVFLNFYKKPYQEHFKFQETKVEKVDTPPINNFLITNTTNNNFSFQKTYNTTNITHIEAEREGHYSFQIFEKKESVEDIINLYGIKQTKDSKENLSSFFAKQKVLCKIEFINKAKNGLGVESIFNFFAKYTSVFEDYESKTKGFETSQKVAELLNEIVLSVDKKGNPKENPITPQNFNAYHNNIWKKA